MPERTSACGQALDRSKAIHSIGAFAAKDTNGQKVRVDTSHSEGRVSVDHEVIFYAAALKHSPLLERRPVAMAYPSRHRLDARGMTGMRPPRISLLHATYRRPGGPLEVRDTWLDRAVDPDFVEYLLSMDADDLATVELTEGVPRLVNPAMGGVVTAVRNWNAAAAAASGDLLVVIADDLFPPQGWDKALIEILGRLDPTTTPFSVKVKDSPDLATVLLRHPVVSRAFYAKFGLFSPAYRGVYCDDDLTARAFWRSAILDGRSLEFEHSHPTKRVTPSESQSRINRRAEYEWGGAHYVAGWSWRQRYAERLLVPTTSPERLTHERLLATQRRLRALSNLRFPFHVLRRGPGALRRRIIWSIRRV